MCIRDSERSVRTEVCRENAIFCACHLVVLNSVAIVALAANVLTVREAVDALCFQPILAGANVHIAIDQIGSAVAIEKLDIFRLKLDLVVAEIAHGAMMGAIVRTLYAFRRHAKVAVANAQRARTVWSRMSVSSAEFYGK